MSELSGGSSFLTTRWSVVRAAGEADTEIKHRALSALCEAYWYPLYAYVRRRGYAAEDAADLVQGFFASLLVRPAFEQLSPERGRFRAWLLASLKNYLSGERARAGALKRGGGRVSLSIDFEDADRRFQLEGRVAETPEGHFERSWAVELVERTLAALEGEYRARGRGTLFEAVHSELGGEEPAEGYAARAEALHMTEGAFKVAAHRLRQRYRERLREEIAETVASEDEVEKELHALFAALSG
jgi:DNA-directed RNA polymerase specialized sigma24 family protein